MSSSLPALLTVHSDEFHDTIEISNQPVLQGESACRRELRADAPYGPGGFDNITLRMESQALSIRNKISEERARSEKEAMERDARHELLYQDHHFKVVV